MEEPKVRKKRPISCTQESRTWIPLVFIGFGLFCVTQAFNLYLRILMDTKNRQILQERDALKQQRDALKDQRDALEQRLQDVENHTSEGWQYFEGGWYLGSNTKQSWKESRKFCQDQGADLIIINSTEEQKFARTAFNEARWIGLSDLEQEGVWSWVDGSLLNTSFWSQGEPNNYDFNEHCGTLYYDDRFQNWNDAICSWKAYCICEK